MNVSISAVCVAAVLCIFCVVCGCTDSGGSTGMSLVVVATEPTPTPDITQGDDGWTVWREGSVTIGRLGEFQTYKPNKNGEYFRNLRVEVDASDPVTLLFLTPDELMNFKTKIMTNSGDYYAVGRYDDVTSGTFHQVGDDDITIALLNEGKKPVTTSVNIWYHT